MTSIRYLVIEGVLAASLLISGYKLANQATEKTKLLTTPEVENARNLETKLKQTSLSLSNALSFANDAQNYASLVTRPDMNIRMKELDKYRERGQLGGTLILFGAVLYTDLWRRVNRNRTKNKIS